MSQLDPRPIEGWPVAQSSALGETSAAVFIGDLPGPYAYAIIPVDREHVGDIEVRGFPDRPSLHRALAALYTLGGKWQWPLSWDRVFVFEPDKPPLMYLVLDHSDDPEEAFE